MLTLENGKAEKLKSNSKAAFKEYAGARTIHQDP